MKAVNNQKTYQKFLLDILNSQENLYDDTLETPLKLNIYLALLSLNNNNYKDEYFITEHEIIDNFLRKVNNLKVKIQLKRKETEIDNLIKDIMNIYQENTFIINKYNREKLNIESIIDSKEPESITNLIDKLTRIKIHKLDNKEDYDTERIKIINNIFKNNYYLEDNNLSYFVEDKKETISLYDFYEIFDYLLDINNYPQEFLSTTVNRQHTILVGSLIELITKEKNHDSITSKEIIPLLLTNILSIEIIDLNDLNTSNFKISNIKITDLYSFANNKENENNRFAKWNKIIIPNDYLYPRIKELIQKGMYYYEENLLTLENVEHNSSDFKISITIDNIISFLNDLLKKDSLISND